MVATYRSKIVHRYKFDQRHIIWTYLTEPAKKVLLMPGEDCLDIIVGLEYGKINKDTVIHIVERNKKVLDKIAYKCVNLGIPLSNLCFYHGQVEDLAAKLFSNSHYDLIYLDLCGQLTYPVLSLIKYMGYKEVFKNTPVFFTFCNHIRNGNELFWDTFKSDLDYSEGIDFKYSVPYAKDYLPHKIAFWTVRTVLDSMNIRSNRKLSINFFKSYREVGMANKFCFFGTDFRPRNRAPRVKRAIKPAIPMKKVESEINMLEVIYSNQVSAGKKAAIRRKINLLKAGS